MSVCFNKVNVSHWRRKLGGGGGGQGLESWGGGGGGGQIPSRLMTSYVMCPLGF